MAIPVARARAFVEARDSANPGILMSPVRQALEENRRTLALAAPIISGHVGQMLMGLADTIMVGRVGVTELAACGFANTLLSVPFVFGFGVLSAVSVRTAVGFGAGRPEACRVALGAGFVIALIMGLAVALTAHAVVPRLGVFGQPQEVQRAMGTYFLISAWSVIPVYLTTAAKDYCEALGRPWVPFWTVIGGVGLNIALNWVLIYGNLGSPAFGLNGAAIATLAARIGVCIAVIASARRGIALAESRNPDTGETLPQELRAQAVIGLPSGGLHLAEVSGFAAGSLMMGWIGTDAMAAHQIAITCAATTFMVPLGLSQAVSVRIGHARGSGAKERLIPLICGALALTVAFMAATAVIFLALGGWIAGAFVAGPVTLLAAQLLGVAGLFQIFDGVQVVSSGALRGFADTRVPFLIGIFAYWMIALPVSAALAFGARMGAIGIWLGFVAGLGVAALALGLRLTRRIARSC